MAKGQTAVSFRTEEVKLFESYFQDHEKELTWERINSKTEFIRWCAIEKLKELYRLEGQEFKYSE
jgi:hypothetical protein